MPCHHLLLRVEIFPVSEGDCEWGVHFDDCRGGEIHRNWWGCCYFIAHKIHLTWGSRSAEAAWGVCTENISFWATDTFSSCQSRRRADPLLSRPPHHLLLQRPKLWLLLEHSLVPDRASLSASFSPYIPLFILCMWLPRSHLLPPQCHLLVSPHLVSFVSAPWRKAAPWAHCPRLLPLRLTQLITATAAFPCITRTTDENKARN